MKYWFLFLFAGFALLSFKPAFAGFLEFFFPALRSQEHQPQFDREAGAVKAPFAELGVREENAAPDMQQKIPDQLSALHGALDVSHRSTEAISDWVALAVAEALVFDRSDFLQDLQTTEIYFDEAGRAQYIGFLNDAGVSSALRARTHDIKSFAQKTPLLLNEGAVEGRYRWLYEVPVKVSFVQIGRKGYEDSNVVSKDYTIRLQVGRQSARISELGILIETWEGIPVSEN